MSRPTPLQVSLVISLLFHAAILGSYELYKSNAVATRPENNSADVLTMDIVAVPEKPSAPTSIQQSVPAPKAMPLKPVMTSPPVAPSPKAVESKVAAPVTPPPAPVISSPTTPTMVAFDASAKPTVQVPRAVKARPDDLKNSPPIYPAAARHRHEEGLVLLAVEVADDGHAAEVDVEKSSGFKLLDDAAVEAVQRWEFQPARIGTMAVASRVEVPIRFELTQP